jgi:hypothetical protein
MAEATLLKERPGRDAESSRKIEVVLPDGRSAKAV